MTDEYRVILFKQKIKAMIPGGEHIRFRRSVDGNHLIIGLSAWLNPAEVAALIETRLRQCGIEYRVVRDPFGFYDGEPVEVRSWSYISIPIDQAALPERRRG